MLIDRILDFAKAGLVQEVRKGAHRLVVDFEAAHSISLLKQERAAVAALPEMRSFRFQDSPACARLTG